MKTVVNSLVMLALAIFGRMFLYGQLSPTGSEASSPDAQARSGGFAQAHIAPLMEKLTGSHFSPQDMAVITVGTLIYATAIGVLSRAVLGSHLFGVRLNGFIALLGSWAALLLYAALFGRASADDFGIIATFAGVGSLLALIGAVLLKAFVAVEAQTFMTGGETRTAAAVKRVAAPSAGKGPSSDRLRAALSRDPR